MEYLHRICRDCIDKSMRLGAQFSAMKTMNFQVVCCVRNAPDAWRSAPAPLCSSDAASEERFGQLIQKLKKKGVNPKQWRLGNFQRMLCLQVRTHAIQTAH
ncbi:uncharacterized protein [Miscanthus floridulus]|uniref:uncharacterized protein isoform X2 n=1 Tax=Miscanthus floridulus TaxID=154761 RepID=UPI003457C5BB